jgi:hypothetical protein
MHRLAYERDGQGSSAGVTYRDSQCQYVDCQSLPEYSTSSLFTGYLARQVKYGRRTCDQVLPATEKTIDTRVGGSRRALLVLYIPAGTKRSGSATLDDGANKQITGSAAERACIHWHITGGAGFDTSGNIGKAGRRSTENAQCGVRRSSTISDSIERRIAVEPFQMNTIRTIADASVTKT